MLIAIIALLILWIYFSGGGTLRTRRLTSEIKELKEENRDLRRTNRALRSSLSSSSERLSRPVAKASRLVEKLVRVKEALRGSKSATEALEDQFKGKVEPGLIQEILSSERDVSVPLKRRLAHGVLVGNIGRDILKGLNEGNSLEDSVAYAGVPLRVGKERVRLLKETGYLDNKLNLTDRGSEALEL